jgi:hypothetical protein
VGVGTITLLLHRRPHRLVQVRVNPGQPGRLRGHLTVGDNARLLGGRELARIQRADPVGVLMWRLLTIGGTVPGAASKAHGHWRIGRGSKATRIRVMRSFMSLYRFKMSQQL